MNVYSGFLFIDVCMWLEGPQGQLDLKHFKKMHFDYSSAERDTIHLPGAVFFFPRHLIALTVAQPLNAETLVIKLDK